MSNLAGIVRGASGAASLAAVTTWLATTSTARTAGTLRTCATRTAGAITGRAARPTGAHAAAGFTGATVRRVASSASRRPHATDVLASDTGTGTTLTRASARFATAARASGATGLTAGARA